MKKANKKWKFFFLALLVLSVFFIMRACNRSVEWDDITDFSFIWYCDDYSGDEGFEINKIEGQHYLTIISRHAFFIEEQHPIPVSEVMALRMILEENNIQDWNGFNRTRRRLFAIGSACGFYLNIDLENGDAITAHGHGHHPSDFNQTRRQIESHLEDVAHRHQVEPVWGNLTSFRLTIPHQANGTSETYAIQKSRENDELLFRYTNNSRWEARRQVEITVDEDVLQELHHIMEMYGIFDWWAGFPESVECENLQMRNVDIQANFDNNVFLHRSGRINVFTNEYGINSPVVTDSEALNAVIDFFEGLKLQQFTEQGINTLFESSLPIAGGLSLSDQTFDTPETPLYHVFGTLLLGEFYVGMEVMFIDDELNALGYGNIVGIRSSESERVEHASNHYEDFTFLVALPYDQAEITEENLWITPK